VKVRIGVIKDWKKILVWLGMGLLVPSVLFNLFLLNQNQDQKSTYLVKEVVDGDTFTTEDYSVVRLLGIGAPELDFCGGQEAKEYLEGLLLGKRVSLEVLSRDSNGRQLAYVYLNKKMVNQQALASGWYYYTGAVSFYAEQLKPVSDQVKEAKIGIYSTKCMQAENLDNPKCQIKGNIGRSSTTQGNKTYHFPGCSRYEDILVEKFRGEDWFCSEKEAQEAGFVKSKNCFGKKYED
jgi:micrococcal nuclease